MRHFFEDYECFHVDLRLFQNRRYKANKVKQVPPAAHVRVPRDYQAHRDDFENEFCDENDEENLVCQNFKLRILLLGHIDPELVTVRSNHKGIGNDGQEDKNLEPEPFDQPNNGLSNFPLAAEDK